jgi:hypothetical protein
MEDRIIDLFKLRRRTEASARILRAELLGNTQAAYSEKSKHLRLLERRIEFADSLLMVANEDQAYEIRRHLYSCKYTAKGRNFNANLQANKKTYRNRQASLHQRMQVLMSNPTLVMRVHVGASFHRKATG